MMSMSAKGIQDNHQVYSEKSYKISVIADLDFNVRLIWDVC